MPLTRLIAIATLALVAATCREPTERLPALGANANGISLSGISSGAYMAGQFQLAHARDVAGAAIIAGGPYGCARSVYADAMPGPGTVLLNLAKAMNGCMQNGMAIWGVPNVPQLAAMAESLADQGRIDPIATLRDDRVYLYTGREDRTVVAPIVAAAAEFYRVLGVPASALQLVEGGPAGHAFVTESGGLACGITAPPYLNDCDYDQAGALLGHILGPLSPPSIVPRGRYILFDQSEHADGLIGHGLSGAGEVYVPDTCRTEAGCRIHIVFHGCGQSRDRIGDAFVEGTGFARWADSNRLIVLFPQVRSTPLNLQACWDWWGYTGPDYLTKDAPQIVAVKRMIDRLTAARVGS